MECSDAVKAEFEREPLPQALPSKPSQDLVALHEVTHIPRQDWCESCVAARSREGAFSSSADPGRREYPTISMDWMFTSTVEGPLATHLIAVDSQTKFVMAIPVEGKGGKSLNYAAEEVVRVASSLGHGKVTIRHDSEPAMIQLAIAKNIRDTRLRMGLATDTEPVAPESSAHGALRAERYILSVRQLGTCLLKTIEQHTGHKVESTEPLFSWAHRHAAFLISRFSVHSDGCTSFEPLHGRQYDAKLCPFGSLVYAQSLPKPKQKGEPWRPCVWLGRTTFGHLNIIADATGVHVARSVRRACRGYGTELIKAMRGVSWNHTLDVLGTKKEKREKFRIAVVLEAPQEVPTVNHAGDEAASDPPSSGPAGDGGDVQMSSAGSASGSLSISFSNGSSEELMPDAGSSSTPPPQLHPGGATSRVSAVVPNASSLSLFSYSHVSAQDASSAIRSCFIVRRSAELEQKKNVPQEGPQHVVKRFVQLCSQKGLTNTCEAMCSFLQVCVARNLKYGYRAKGGVNLYMQLLPLSLSFPKLLACFT